jgi:hypothetical protein
LVGDALNVYLRGQLSFLRATIFRFCCSRFCNTMESLRLGQPRCRDDASNLVLSDNTGFLGDELFFRFHLRCCSFNHRACLILGFEGRVIDARVRCPSRVAR